MARRLRFRGEGGRVEVGTALLPPVVGGELVYYGLEGRLCPGEVRGLAI